MICKNCEAFEETCCEAAKSRRAMTITLANLVDRQGTTIRLLRKAILAEQSLRHDLIAKAGA